MRHFGYLKVCNGYQQQGVCTIVSRFGVRCYHPHERYVPNFGGDFQESQRIKQFFELGDRLAHGLLISDEDKDIKHLDPSKKTKVP